MPETDNEKQTVTAYDKIAAPWIKSRFNDKFWEKECEQLKKLTSPPASIIELGCAGGRKSAWFTAQGYNYIGIDASKNMIEEAKKNFPNNKFFQMNVLNLNAFNKESFDAFWAAAVLLHISPSNINKALKEIKRILKPRAAGFIAVKEGKGEAMLSWGEIPDSPKGYFVFYQSDEFANILNNNGFEILEQSDHYSALDTSRDFLTYLVRTK